MVIAEDIYRNPTSHNFNQLQITTTDYIAMTEDATDQDTWISKLKMTQIFEPLVTVWSWIWLILATLLSTINPFSISPGSFTTPPEVAIAYGIVLFRIVILTVGVFEAIMLVRQKKQN